MSWRGKKEGRGTLPSFLKPSYTYGSVSEIEKDFQAVLQRRGPAPKQALHFGVYLVE